MASVQSAPAMQAGMTPLPPNVTPQQVQEVYQVCRSPFVDDPIIIRGHTRSARLTPSRNFSA
jgi:hypothetical protein